MAEIGKDIQLAKRLLEAGELVAIPTETVYGLAGNALNVEAITKIFEAKNRPHFDPLIVHVADFNSIKSFASTIPGKAKLLAEKFWPGPLTFLLNRKEIIPDLVTAGLETVGIRCPNHPLTIRLLKDLSFPLAAPSANPFGYISPTKASHVNDQLGEKIKYILEGGDCEVGIESTIVGFEDEKVIIHRLGGLSVENIESVIGKVEIQINSSSNPKAPGQLKSHYAPTKSLMVGNTQALLEKYRGKKIGILSYQKLKANFPVENQRVLTSSNSMREAAQNLFAFLRELDQLDVDFIIAEEVPSEGLGRAINDRLHRASVNIVSD